MSRGFFRGRSCGSWFWSGYGLNGETVAQGYAVGESVIYPGYGGYTIISNPNIEWTVAMKKAYVATHQDQVDLAAFLKSPYANSPEALQARSPLATSKVGTGPVGRVVGTDENVGSRTRKAIDAC